MIALATFFVVLILSLLIVRIASLALTLTGLSDETARFQARSAWTGTGFTTQESESVVTHPVRRRIVTILMVLRGAGLITAASALVLSFSETSQEDERLTRLVWLVLGLLGLWLISGSRWVDRRLSIAIRWALHRWTDLDVRDFAQLLHLGDNYAVTELRIRPEDWLADRPLSELKLPDEGVLILGIQRSNREFIGVPRGTTQILPGDTVILYGRGSLLSELDQRRQNESGEAAHRQSVREQREVLREQEQKEQPDFADDSSGDNRQ